MTFLQRFDFQQAEEDVNIATFPLMSNWNVALPSARPIDLALALPPKAANLHVSSIPEAAAQPLTVRPFAHATCGAVYSW